MKANNILASIAVTLIILNSSCCKEPKEECDEPWFVEIAEPLKDYLFMPGSKWVYLHENTGLKDTIILQSVVDTLWYPIPPIPDVDETYQMCRFIYYSSRLNKMYSDIIYENSIRRNEQYIIRSPQALYVHSEAPYTAPIFEYIELINEISINNVVYHNVRHFKTVGSAEQDIFYPYDTDTYYVPNVGLVKWVEHDPVNGDQTFSMQSSSVTKYNLIKRCKHE